MAKHSSSDQQMRIRIAQEAARLITEEGIKDYLVAKRKAAQRLGVTATRNLPRNNEIEAALQDHQRLFQADTQPRLLQELRQAAVGAMKFFEAYNPRLTGPVLLGTASMHSEINLHLFADTPEEVALFLMENNIPFESIQRRFRFQADSLEEIPALQFVAGHHPVELAIFPRSGRRVAPRSPIDGKPMSRADVSKVEALLPTEAAPLD